MKSVPKSETRWKGYKICSLLLGNFGLRLMGFKQSCNGRWLIVFWLLKLLLIFIQFGQLLFSARSSLNLKQWATKGLGLAIRINPHAKMACSSDIWGKKLVEKSHFFSEILTEKSVVEKTQKRKYYARCFFPRWNYYHRKNTTLHNFSDSEKKSRRKILFCSCAGLRHNSTLILPSLSIRPIQQMQ